MRTNGIQIEIPTATDKAVIKWIMGELNDIDVNPLTTAKIAKGVGVTSADVSRSLGKQIIQEELHRLAHADFIDAMEVRLVQNSLVKVAAHFKQLLEDENTKPRDRLVAGKEYQKLLKEYVKERGIEEEYMLIPPKKLEMMERAYIATLKAKTKTATDGASAVSTGIVPLGIAPEKGMGERPSESPAEGVSGTV